jgi:Protein of unknown function (DUF4019)
MIARKRFILVVTLVLLGGIAYAADANPKAAAGAKAAADWLILLDNGKYGDAWKQLSPSQKPTTNKDRWQSEVSRYRNKVGKVRGRKLAGAEYMTKLPGSAEEGEYVVATFESGFEKLGGATEVVIEQLLPDGSWVVSGYDIKPADVTD